MGGRGVVGVVRVGGGVGGRGYTVEGCGMVEDGVVGVDDGGRVVGGLVAVGKKYGGWS